MDVERVSKPSMIKCRSKVPRKYKRTIQVQKPTNDPKVESLTSICSKLVIKDGAAMDVLPLHLQIEVLEPLRLLHSKLFKETSIVIKKLRPAKHDLYSWELWDAEGPYVSIKYPSHETVEWDVDKHSNEV